MGDSFLSLDSLTACVLVAVVAASLVAYNLKSPARLSRAGVIISILPGFLTLGLFYSLVFHMQIALGHWPNIKESDFPALLNFHAAAAEYSFEALLIASLLIWPIAFILFLLIRPWRSRVGYLAVYGAAFLVCFVAIQHWAPAQFLDWWWD
jgi:hypothetical protein